MRVLIIGHLGMVTAHPSDAFLDSSSMITCKGTFTHSDLSWPFFDVQRFER